MTNFQKRLKSAMNRLMENWKLPLTFWDLPQKLGMFCFSRELELLDDHEETLEKLEIGNALGGMIGFTYTF